MWTQSKIAIKRRLFKTVKDELICRSLAFNSHHCRSFCSKSKGVNLFGHKISSINEESKRDIIFLHGLLCQSRHWRSFALNDVFSKRAHCHLLDLRNHGESDHHSSMSYKEMAEDVIRYADQAGLNTFDLIGHAVGGKLAIAIGCLFKDRVKSIISLDAAPVDNNSDPNLLQKNIKSLDELLSLDIEGKTRKTVIDLLNEKYTDKGIANIVSMNIIYDGDQSNTVKWCTNIRETLVGFEPLGTCSKPFLCIYGQHSRKYPLEVFQKVLPKCDAEHLVEISGAGHWVHFERMDETLRKINQFYMEQESTSG